MIAISIPVTGLWILGFYNLFHLWLNILSEVLRFGDRTFYKDWWNCTNFKEYWSLWN